MITQCIVNFRAGRLLFDVLNCIRLRSVAVRMAQALVRARGVPTQP